MRQLALAIVLFSLTATGVARADLLNPDGRGRGRSWAEIEQERREDARRRERQQRIEQPEQPDAEPVTEDVDTSDDSLGYVVLGGVLALWTATYAFRRRALAHQMPRTASTVAT